MRRDKFCCLIKNGVHGKNKVIHGLSSCIVQKFNGYELMIKSLQHKEKKHFEQVDIVYEPVIDESTIKCFVMDSLHLTFRSYKDKKQKGDYRLLHPVARQCYYCDNYLTCSKNEFIKRINKYMSTEGIIYKFKTTKLFLFKIILSIWGMFLSLFTLTLKLRLEIMFFTIQKCLSSAIVKFAHFIRA